MLPPESVVRAARRWLDLLRRSTTAQAWALLQANSTYADLPAVRYLQALDWLQALGLLIPVEATSRLDPALTGLSSRQADQLLYMRGLVLDHPPWLADSDLLITAPAELPSDAADLAGYLELSDFQALAGIRQARGKVDAELTAAIGLQGELALCAALETSWPGSTVHLAAVEDGWGYDIAFSPTPQESWHLEVKTTTRRGRLAVFLSRNEHTVGLSDPQWRAVTVGLDDKGKLAAVATVKPEVVAGRAPRDMSPSACWASARYQLRADDLDRGLPFILAPVPPIGAVLRCGIDHSGRFAWMPSV